MRLIVRTDALKTPFSTRLILVIQMSSNKVLAEVTKVVQSNGKIPLDEWFTIGKSLYIIGVKASTGSGKSLEVQDYAKDTHLKKSIITVRNNNNLCCGRALAVGKALADNHSQLKQLTHMHVIHSGEKNNATNCKRL